MGWGDWLDDAIDKAGGALKASPGVVMDIAKWTPPTALITRGSQAAFDFVRDPGQGTFIRGLTGSIGVPPELGQVSFLKKPAKQAGRAIGEFAGVAGTLAEKTPVFRELKQGGEQFMDGYTWVRDNINQSLAYAQRFYQEDPMRLIPGATLVEQDLKDQARQYWRETEHVSPGQQFVAPIGALAEGVPYKEAIRNPLQFQEEEWFHWTSGTADFISSFTLDPLVIGGRTAALARESLVIRPVNSRDIDKILESTAINRATRWVLERQGKPDEIARHHAISRKFNASGEAIADVLSKAGDEATVKLVFKAGMGNVRALDELALKRADLKATIDRVSGNREALLDFTFNRAANSNHTHGMSALERETTENMRKELTALEGQDNMLLRIEDEIFGSMIHRTPGAPGSFKMAEMRHKWATMDVAQRSWYSTPVRVIRSMQDRRLGVVKYHERNAGVHVDEFLKRVPNMEAETRSALVAKAMGADTEQKWVMALETAERRALESVGETYGFTPKQVESIYQSYSKSRAQVVHSIQTRQYTSVTDPQTGRTLDLWKDPLSGEFYHAALVESQLRDAHFMLDVDEVVKTMKRHTGLLKRSVDEGTRASISKGLNDVSAGADFMNGLWKTSVLLRLGYPLRVLGDDQGRLFAKYGALAMLGDMGPGAKNFLRNQTSRLKEVGRRQVRGEPLRQKGVPLLPEEQVARIGTEDSFAYRGVNIPGAHKDSPEYARLISSQDAFANFVMGKEGEILAEARKHGATGWRTIAHDPSNPVEHTDAWRRVINQQLSNSAVSRRLMEGETPRQVARWLTSGDPQARALRRRIPTWTWDADDYVGRIAMITDEYVPMALREKALAGNVTGDDLASVLKKPNVHGEQIAVELGEHSFVKRVEQFQSASMKLLNSLPTDILSRNPGFKRAYDQYMKQAVDNLLAQGVDLTGTGRSVTGMPLGSVAVRFEKQAGQDLLKKQASWARRQALNEMKNLLFDLSSKSQWAHSVRLLAPFAAAWQDTLAVWMRLGAEKPHQIGRLLAAFDAPARGGILTNALGEEVESEGIHFPEEGEYIKFPLPKGLAKLIGMEKAGLGLKSGNLVMQGDPFWLPGTGPVVQMPVNELAIRTKPEIADYLPFVLPFGAQQGGFVERNINLALPAVAKRLVSATDPESDASYANTVIRIMQGEQARYLNGEREGQPGWDEIFGKAKNFNIIRALAQIVTPAQLQFYSPAQFYIDEWRRIRDDTLTGGGSYYDAENLFLEKYGDESWVFMTSVSKNNTGLPATMEAVRASRKYGPLLAAYPDQLASAIVGSEGSGAFSSTAYNIQLNEQVAPGGKKFREKQSPRDVFEGGFIDAGWREYSKAMNALDAKMMDDLGHLNYAKKEAEQYRQAKNQIVKAIGEEYVNDRGEHLWLSDFRAIEGAAAPERYEQLKRLSNEPVLRNNPIRTDIKVLSDYFVVRDQFLVELVRRDNAGGSATLTANSNEDLLEEWETFKGTISEADPMFGDFYHRWLENDVIQMARGVTTLPEGVEWR